jgi:hypothetical protein
MFSQPHGIDFSAIHFEKHRKATHYGARVFLRLNALEKQPFHKKTCSLDRFDFSA